MVTYPNDWLEVKLNEISDVRDGTHDSPQYVSHGYPLVTSKNLKNGKIDWRDIQFISKNDFDSINKRSKVDAKDILMGMIGTIGNIARTPETCKFAIKNVALIKNTEKTNMTFLLYYLQSSNIASQLEDQADGGNQKFIALNKIRDFVIFLPSDPEQQAIASVLSDFDEHIDNLTNLIKKKKAIRDGALEDLISGKTRLDGFDGEWKTISFNQYFTLLPTNTYSREQLSDSGEIGNIHYGDILIKYGYVLSENDYIPRLIDKSKLNARQYLKKNDVIIADTAEDETVGKSVQIGDIDMPLVSGLHTMACRPNHATADGYLGYYINSNCFHDQILPYVTGIKVSSISKKSIRETELYIPVNIEEQQAIASVLTAMDGEIESLKAEKEKMMEIREGAMDDLLTGRVRLKI